MIFRVTKVKGHADAGMVSNGRVRELDRLGNNAADEAADFGRRRVGPAVTDARRNLSGVCGRWYPVLLDLHRFFIAISRAVVNHDGLLVRLLLLMLMMSLSGPTLLVFWLRGFLFLVLCIGLFKEGILVWVVFLLLSY